MRSDWKLGSRSDNRLFHHGESVRSRREYLDGVSKSLTTITSDTSHHQSIRRPSIHQLERQMSYNPSQKVMMPMQQHCRCWDGNSSDSDSEHDSDGGRSGRSGRSSRSMTSVGWLSNASVGAGIGGSYRMSRSRSGGGNKDGSLRITQQSTLKK